MTADAPIHDEAGINTADPVTVFAATYASGAGQLLTRVLSADLETPVAAFLKLAGDTPYSFLFESVEGGKFRGRYSFLGLDPDLVWQAQGNRAEIRVQGTGDGHQDRPASSLMPHPAGEGEKKDSFPTEREHTPYNLAHGVSHLHSSPLSHWERVGVRADSRETPSPLTPHPNALHSLKAQIAASHMVLPAGMPPMAAGLFGFLGYGCAGLAENLPQSAPDPLGLPDGLLLRPRLVVIFDHVAESLTLATPVYPAPAVSAAAAHAAAIARLDTAEARLAAPVPAALARRTAANATGRDGAGTDLTGAPIQQDTPPMPVTSNLTASEFCALVERAKDYIRAGDIFQVVPSQRLSRPYTKAPFSLYRSLRRLNPSPFLFYLNMGDFQLVGSSPEILVRLRDNTVTVRPIAGTRSRGRTAAEDAALAADLLADPKERAEHLMLLDLGRNDVGRVAVPGSVRVTEQFTVEMYSHVMHIVSNVEGTLRPDCDAVDALLAGFPAGTVSGAPKIRAMQIIDELEPVRRAFYAGAVGYFSAGGDMDTCIALRTGLIKDGVLHVQAGAGVVADSVPLSEYQETVNKAQALLRAADLTH
jgi:anthranilate synthase component I